MTRRKRLFDVGCAAVGLGVFAPVIGGLAVAVWAESGSPVVFVQERIGEGGRPFQMIKVRSMADGRVTRVGRWIRATGLDETLQFVHVLRGEMSMVGPRPMTADDLRRLGWMNSGRATQRPGITGPAQVWSPEPTAALQADLAYEGAGLAVDAAMVGVSFAVNVAGKSRVKGLLQRLPPRARRWLREPTDANQSPQRDHRPVNVA